MFKPSLAGGSNRCNINNFLSVSRTKKGRDSASQGDDESSTLLKTDDNDWTCESCNTTLIYVRKDAQRVCPDSGTSSFFQEMTRGDIISQGCTPTTAYLYKRHNHFKTWLKMTQGKETTCVPEEVVEMVHKEYRIERVTGMSRVDHHKSRLS